MDNGKKITMQKLLFLFFLPSIFLSADWPQYHGPLLNKSTEAPLLKQISSLGEKPHWTTPTPLGFSSFSTSQNQAFTLIAEEDEDGLFREVCIALDLRSGRRLWQIQLGGHFMDIVVGMQEPVIIQGEMDHALPHR